MSRELVSYDVGPFSVSAPKEWSALTVANAECELRCGHKVTEPLALLAMLHFASMDSKLSRNDARQLAAFALELGWRPGDIGHMPAVRRRIAASAA